MTTLLIMTTGQTDVQVVAADQRHKLDGRTCGTLHDEIGARAWSVVDPPPNRSRDVMQCLPSDGLQLCTPKLESVLKWFKGSPPVAVLLLETTTAKPTDPRYAGVVLAERLAQLGFQNVERYAYLSATGEATFDDQGTNEDAVVKRSVICGLSAAISAQIAKHRPTRVVISMSGGPPPIKSVVEELTRLHSVGVVSDRVVSLDAPESSDIAVEEKFNPAAGYRARWHALSLVETGNLLGAWGAVRHLKDEPGQAWTEVIEWLAQFASSLPLSGGCELKVLRHASMAVQAALRVELALLAGDIPRAVHGTVAFFEAALWDHLNPKVSRHPSERKFQFHCPPPAGLLREQDKVKLELLSRTKLKENDKLPFIPKDLVHGVQWYWIDDTEVPATKIAKDYLKLGALERLAKAVNGDIRALRNDVSHNVPTPDLMLEASTRMQGAGLWSDVDTFLSQELVQNVLLELGIGDPGLLCRNLLSDVRARLQAVG